MEREREDTCRKPCITMSQPPLGPSDWDMFDEIGLNLIEPHQVQHKQIPICMVTDRRIEVEIRVWDDIKTKKIKKSRSPQVWRLISTFKKLSTSQSLRVPILQPFKNRT